MAVSINKSAAGAANALDSASGKAKKKVAEKAPPVNYIYKLTDESHTGRVDYTGEADVFDPETQQIRRARLLRGVSTLWADEQKHVDKAYVRNNSIVIQFVNGVATVPAHEQLIRKYMELSNGNIENPNRYGSCYYSFKEWNPVKEAKADLDKELSSVEATKLAATQPLEKMLPHASYLGVSMFDEMGGNATEDRIRHGYIRKAMEDPKLFITTVDAPVVAIQFMVANAVNNGAIDLGKVRGSAYWQTGGFITVLPDGKDAVEYLTQFAMQDKEENVLFVKQLKDYVAE